MTTSFDELKVRIFDFKKRYKKVISNYFSQDLSSRELIVFCKDQGMLIFAYDEDYAVYKVYFMVDAIEVLDDLFAQSKWNQNSSLEIVFRNEIDDELKRVFARYGFIEFAMLKKMSFLTNAGDFSGSDNKALYCGFEDLDNLMEIFQSEFDRYSESLPSRNEVEHAIKFNSVIKIAKGKKILGFLWFDEKKFLTELRYLFVDKDYRGRQLSKKLMMQYLYLVEGVKKKQLWVLEKNEVAINLYKKFGYEFEEIKDKVFKKELSDEK